MEWTTAGSGRRRAMRRRWPGSLPEVKSGTADSKHRLTMDSGKSGSHTAIEGADGPGRRTDRASGGHGQVGCCIAQVAQYGGEQLLGLGGEVCVRTVSHPTSPPMPLITTGSSRTSRADRRSRSLYSFRWSSGRQAGPGDTASSSSRRRLRARPRMSSGSPNIACPATSCSTARRTSRMAFRVTPSPSIRPRRAPGWLAPGFSLAWPPDASLPSGL